MAPTLFTIGYEGSSVDQLLAQLRAHEVDTLIDVRDVPISRKPGFSKTALSHALGEAGIAYVHLKGLGDPKPGRLAARERRYQDFRRIFTAHMQTPAAQSDLSTAIGVAHRSRSCLMCFELDHRNCHRCIVAERMGGAGFTVSHLNVSPTIAGDRRLRLQSTHEHAPAAIGDHRSSGDGEGRAPTWAAARGDGVLRGDRRLRKLAPALSCLIQDA